MRPETLLVRATKHPVPRRRKRVKPNKKTGRDDSMLYSDQPSEHWPNDSFTRRAIRRGDLSLVKSEAPSVQPIVRKKVEG